MNMLQMLHSYIPYSYLQKYLALDVVLFALGTQCASKQRGKTERFCFFL